MCDNVISYQVVLEGGKVVNASQSENPDLWRALKGGGNNFGVVTQMELATFTSDGVLDGNTYSDISTAQDQLSALFNFTASRPYDKYASVIQSFSFSGPSEVAVVNSLVYTKPELSPPSLQPFFNIPSLEKTSQITNVSSVTRDQGASSTNGRR